MWSMQWPKPWWPIHLGQPNSSGSQGNLHYAYFDNAHRLVINENGQLKIYDTGDHRISGVSQEQSNTSYSITFTSQSGNVNLQKLKIVEG